MEILIKCRNTVLKISRKGIQRINSLDWQEVALEFEHILGIQQLQTIKRLEDLHDQEMGLLKKAKEEFEVQMLVAQGSAWRAHDNFDLPQNDEEAVVCV